MMIDIRKWSIVWVWIIIEVRIWVRMIVLVHRTLDTRTALSSFLIWSLWAHILLKHFALLKSPVFAAGQNLVGKWSVFPTSKTSSKIDREPTQKIIIAVERMLKTWLRMFFSLYRIARALVLGFTVKRAFGSGLMFKLVWVS